ncbi:MULTISPECIES: hypothetical protein [Klebsiella]|uniref:hypothetical protein n=1 Tax=Klebsiella TaxID=570 RepID=UPI0019BDBA31|nr:MULTISPECIES: hypothetical protein [Klebsiella]MBD7154303.1 hypothetical protein [Klebsiella pneumoniae]MBP3138353.1 hypothetical protein [Klebsiella pneumoniae]HBM3271205.1 hypothetical protein [Klebsiella michiganensis]
MTRLTLVVEFEDGKAPSVHGSMEVFGGKVVAVAFRDALEENGNGVTAGKPLIITLPNYPELGSHTEWYQGFKSGSEGMHEDCRRAVVSCCARAGIDVEVK